jgi:hypothetical protein
VRLAVAVSRGTSNRQDAVSRLDGSFAGGPEPLGTDRHCEDEGNKHDEASNNAGRTSADLAPRSIRIILILMDTGWRYEYASHRKIVRVTNPTNPDATRYHSGRVGFFSVERWHARIPSDRITKDQGNTMRVDQDLENDLREHRIILGNHRGSGAYGDVFECEYDGFLQGAAKISIRPIDTTEASLDRGELRKLQSLTGLTDCPNLLRLLRFLIVREHLVTIWDLCDTDLAKVLKGHQNRAKGSGLPRDDLSRWFTQVGAALEYVHKQGYLHRDIKPSNILLRKDNAFLGDLGSIAYLGLSKTHLSFAGTEVYHAPEITRTNTSYSVGSDIYSLALCYIELRTGVFPLGDDTRLYHQKKLQSRYSLEGLVPGEREQLERALSVRPDDRPKEVGRWMRRLLQEARTKDTYACRVGMCDAQFTNFEGLLHHVEDTHYWHLCRGCLVSFPTIHNLKHHQRTATEPVCRGRARADR